MTQDEIIEMARQAGMALENYGGTLLVRHLPSDSIEAFAKLVAAKEREACAIVSDRYADIFGTVDDDMAKAIASDIRARGEA